MNKPFSLDIYNNVLLLTFVEKNMMGGTNIRRSINLTTP